MTFEVKPASEIPNESARAKETIYPFGTMRIGEVFKVPADHPAAQKSTASRGPERVRVAASAYGKRTGTKFVCNAQPDGSIRVERIA